MLLAAVSWHYRYTKHAAPSAVRTVIDGGKYPCFSLLLSASPHNVTLARDVVSFPPLMAKILSITFASLCYAGGTSLYSLGYVS
jgi:hypothetical protein